MEPIRRPRGRPREDKTDPKTNQSLEKALSLLKVLSAHDGMTLTDLSAAADQPPSTVHRLLGTLSANDFVAFDEATQTWAIGIESLRVGMAFQRRNKILLAGRPIMTALMEAIGETVNMAMLDRFQVVFVTQVECEAPIRAFFRIGERRPAYASGIGKALLAHLPASRLDPFLKTEKLTALTPATLADPVALRGDLEAIRTRGWSLDNEEATPGMRCIAAPIFNEFGEARAGISLSGPASRLTDDRIAALGTQVKAAADSISDLIGGRLLS
ncbi:hypothetical protein ABAC460_22760 [Asticcacaulis sp. AC460]|uniref:IclR family transcriptional regulator n=1 Tax=Asticcacaulis sp. AC460 TaxID=1282360 RepID=UPI0003C3ECFD|nr:IclR family transcriptional regulator [Asticcacaulis sp. AC460]ESQ86652.1 hypothetical protein ABAC460_22760 [Asticcacaulis sp. AC460]